MGMNSAIAPAVQQAAQTALQNQAAQQPAQGAIGQGVAQAAQMGTQNLAGQPALSPAAQQAAQNPISQDEFKQRLAQIGKGTQPPTPQQQALRAALNPNKGGQPPTPQQLGQGLQQQAAMSNTAQSAASDALRNLANRASVQSGQPPAGQIPMSMQRQPQGGMAGRTPQIGTGMQMQNRFFRR